MKERQYLWQFRTFYNLLFLGSLLLCAGQSCLGKSSYFFRPVYAQERDGTRLVQLGVSAYQQGQFQGAIEHWQSALEHYHQSDNSDAIALVSENLARAYQQVGQHQQALEKWQMAAQQYRQAGQQRQWGRMLTEQAQTYQQLGQYRVAIALLCPNPQPTCPAGSALALARTHTDTTGEIAALGSLGELERLQGNYPQAITWLETGLAIAQTHDPKDSGAILNSLGTVYVSRGQLRDRKAHSLVIIGDTDLAETLTAQAEQNYTTALNYFKQSQTLAHQHQNQAAALTSTLNLIPIYQRLSALDAAQSSRKVALDLLIHLPNSQTKVFALLDLVEFAAAQAPDTSSPAPPRQFSGPRCWSEAQPTQKLLETALEIAKQINDPRSQSFALGQLGHLWECQNNYPKALALTQQARSIAEQLNNRDSLYQWEWQAGRIFAAINQPQNAMNAYQQALATLDKIRDKILVANRDRRLDFRETIEPIYRQLSALGLAQFTHSPLNTTAITAPQPTETVLKTIDGLQLALLQNYFGNDCVITELPTETTDFLGKDSQTAIFNTIIFQDRVAIIVTLPNRQHKLFWLKEDFHSITDTLNTYRQTLEKYYIRGPFDTHLSQQLYNQIIRPIEADLTQWNVETLVFVQDGIFRSVPMASLHDGTDYLIQTYAVATTPSLALTIPGALPNNRQTLSTLAMGITQATSIDGKYFPSLDHVEPELVTIKSQLPKSRILRNQDVTRNRIAKALSSNRHNIVHLATHATFGPDPENTFLVIGNNQKLTLNDFDTLMRENTTQGQIIDLLLLTACQTGVGDDRAALGLAGVALQAGTKSVLASLWSVNDQATAQFVEHLYTQLRQPQQTKAKALQAAQLEILKDNAHPYYWSPFILMGNWQ